MSTELNDTPNDAAQTTTTTATGPYPNPVAHGMKISTVLDDGNALYRWGSDFWFEHIGRPEEEPENGLLLETWDPEFLPGTYDLRFRSSRWKAGMEKNGEWKRYHKYHLTLRRRSDASKTPPISLSIQIEPQIEGLTYPGGNELTFPYGEGTRLSIQTTYPDGPEAPVDRAFSAIEAVAPEAIDRSAYQRETSRLTKLEAHVRFDITRKNAVVKTIDNTRELLAYGGGTSIEAHQNRAREGYVESMLVSDRWERLGFDPLAPAPEIGEADDHEQLLKCYQAGDWNERSPADPMHHPKLEAALAGGTVHLSSYWSALSELRSKVVSHARWAGIRPSDLVSDPFYGGSDAPSEHYPEVGDRRESLRDLQQSYDLPMHRQATHDQTDKPHDIMEALVAESGATYETLEERTGICRRTIEYHVEKFEDLGFVERVGSPVVVVFDSVGVLDLASEVLDKTHPGETPSDRLSELEDRAEERREKRERRQESDETTEADPSPDTEPKGEQQSVWRYFEDMGITPDRLRDRLNHGDLSGRDVRVRSEPPDASPDSATAD